MNSTPTFARREALGGSPARNRGEWQPNDVDAPIVEREQTPEPTPEPSDDESVGSEEWLDSNTVIEPARMPPRGPDVFDAVGRTNDGGRQGFI